MNKSTLKPFIYGLAGLACMLFSSLGYVAGHKYFSAAQIIGMSASLWQVLVAVLVIAAAGGIGESLLKFLDIDGLIRAGLTAAAGLIVLAVTILAWGSLVGTNSIFFGIFIVAINAIFYKNILAWFKNFGQLSATISGKPAKIIAAGVILILGGNLLVALAPPVEWDSLVYHYAIPSTYINLGRIAYLPDTMFWGMPQLTEMLYLPQISLAGPESAAVFGVLIAALAMIGILGYVKSKFDDIAAWTSIAALLSGASLTYTISTGYVDWVSILFGWATLVALNEWLEKQDQRLLLLAGVFCGGALGTKYTAGVILICSIFVLILMQKPRSWKTVFSSVFLLGLAATLASAPWWIKNFMGTGNPFYPFFIPSGAMDQTRLRLYQSLPAWKDWRAVIFLPWQATFMGFDGKEGFAATVGPLLVGLGPLAVINSKLKEPHQKTTIGITSIVAITGLILWGIGSRFSGLLIQTRLYFAIFPALAILAGAGIHAFWNLSSMGVRFGRLTWMLAMFMFGLNVFAFCSGMVTSINPFSYLLQGEDRNSYLLRRLGGYMLAMQSVKTLPDHSQVLMLWEPRGYYCQPLCDSDEVLDRWSSDSSKYFDSPAVMHAWKNQGYSHILIFNTGKEFIRTEDPQGASINWALLDATLKDLTVEKQIQGGIYTLYRLP